MRPTGGCPLLDPSSSGTYPMNAMRNTFIQACLWIGLSLYSPCAYLASDKLSAQENLADVIERCEKAVVRIEVQDKEGSESLGSGFVVDATGIVVTNVHVLSGAEKAEAIFSNGQTAKVLGTLYFDPKYDICVCKIDSQALPVLEFSDALPRKGETVVALGSPKGLSFTATNGIVSAIRPSEELGPEIGREHIKGTWIQVDAPLSGGNSGGPLINAKGRVVAMSTLASQGSAQNLNFGISGPDIRNAVASSRSATLIPLPEGIGKLKLEEDDDPPDSLLERPPIPDERLQQFVAEARSGFGDLTRGLRTELKDLNEKYQLMRRGETYIPDGGANPQVEVVRSIRGKSITYFFRSSAIKSRIVNELQARIKMLTEMRDKFKDPANNFHLYKVLSSYGPRLDTRRYGAIGFIPNATVLRAMTDHDVIIDYEDTPYLLWVESTAGLFGGSELLPRPVFVAGTATLPGRDGTPISATLLHSLTDAEMRKAFLGSDKAGSDEWRIWKDKSGKFQIEAQLVEVKSDKVRLLKRNGEVKEVPIAIFCQSDREFIGRDEE